MLLFGHDIVCWKPVREGPDLTRCAAGRRLSGERERAVAGFGDFPRQKMDVVDQVVTPDTAGVLVEAHGPERDDLAVRVRIEFRQFNELVFWYA